MRRHGDRRRRAKRDKFSEGLPDQRWTDPHRAGTARGERSKQQTSASKRKREGELNANSRKKRESLAESRLESEDSYLGYTRRLPTRVHLPVLRADLHPYDREQSDLG